MELAIWNTLHDGSIESAQGEVPGDVTLKVEIRYLCAELPTAAGHLVVRLRQCERFEYRPFEGDPVIRLEDIGSRCVEVLSATRKGEGVEVVCVDGVLYLAYGGVEASVAEGHPVSQEELEAAADRYWTKWEERDDRGRGGGVAG